MRWISKRAMPFLLWLVLSVNSPGQSGQSGGCVRVINAVGCKEAVHIEMNGKALHKSGCHAGFVSGGLWVPQGECQWKISMTGVEDLKVKHHVREGDSMVLVVFLTRVEPEEGEAGWKLRFKFLKPFSPLDGKTLSMISMSSRPRLKMSIGQTDRSWLPVDLVAGESKRIKLDWPHGYVPMRLLDKKVDSIPVAANANYVALVYDKLGGGVGVLSYKDRVYGRELDE